MAKAHAEACSIQGVQQRGLLPVCASLGLLLCKVLLHHSERASWRKGYADVALIPYKPDVPAIIIELKKDDTVDAAISQIRERRYPEALEKYRLNLLLVAITYDSKTKEHRARIEKA